jgi:hypothetical protein
MRSVAPNPCRIALMRACQFAQADAIHTLRKRFPSWSQVLPVLGVIMLMIYTWTLMRFFWKLPSWLYFLNGEEILTMLAYSLVTNFAESLAVLCGPLFLALALPRAWFGDLFVARGGALSIAGLGYMMFLGEQFNNYVEYPTLSLPTWTVLLALAGIALLVYLFGRIGWLRKLLEEVAERASIFAYILAPVSGIAMLAIVVRILLS